MEQNNKVVGSRNNLVLIWDGSGKSFAVVLLFPLSASSHSSLLITRPSFYFHPFLFPSPRFLVFQASHFMLISILSNLRKRPPISPRSRILALLLRIPVGIVAFQFHPLRADLEQSGKECHFKRQGERDTLHDAVRARSQLIMLWKCAGKPRSTAYT